jgi:hypothetical protein
MDRLAFAKNIADRVEAQSARAKLPVAACVDSEYQAPRELGRGCRRKRWHRRTGCQHSWNRRSGKPLGLPSPQHVARPRIKAIAVWHKTPDNSGVAGFVDFVDIRSSAMENPVLLSAVAANNVEITVDVVLG